MRIRIGKTEFKIKIAETPDELTTGLLNTDSLPKGEGLLLKSNSTEKIIITMRGMKYPLDLVFISNNKVVGKKTAEPEEVGISIDNDYDSVLEINKGESFGIRSGNKIEYIGEKKEDGTVEMAEGGLMPKGNRHLLDEKGRVQMNLLGGEWVFSRKATKRMFELAKQKKYKTLGRFLYREIKAQEKRPTQYADN